MASKRRASAAPRLSGGAARRGKKASVGPAGRVRSLGAERLARKGGGTVRNRQRKAKARKR